VGVEHLKPFVKGQSGNPGGMPRIPDHLRGIASLTQGEVTKIVSKYARMTCGELQAVGDSADTPVLEVAIASVFMQAIKHGDYTRLAFLLDRAIGKVAATDGFQEGLPSKPLTEEAKVLATELLRLVAADGS
jgi:hypothetical protein